MAGRSTFGRILAAISLLFPVHVAAMLLATTSVRLGVVDGISFINLLVGALAMRACVRAFCRRLDRPLPEWTAVFIAVSYVTSVYSLAIGSSWFSFLANQAAVPIIAFGLVSDRRKTGIALVSIGMLYNITGGHLAPFFYTVFFLGLLCLSLAAVFRRWEPIVRYASGSLLAMLLVSPILWRLVSTFSGSSRNVGFAEDQAIQYNLSLPALFLGGTIGIDSIGAWDFQPILGFLAEIALPLSFSAVAICLIGVLMTARRFRSFDWTLLALLLVVGVFIHRPSWLQTIISQRALLPLAALADAGSAGLSVFCSRSRRGIVAPISGAA